jgi:hypothetical protein
MADAFDALGFIPDEQNKNDPFAALGFVADSNQPTNKYNDTSFGNALPDNSKLPGGVNAFKNIMGLMADPHPMKSILVGAGRGFTDLGEGLKQKYLQAKDLLAEHGYTDPGNADDFQKQTDFERAFYENNMREYSQSPYAQAGRFGANNAPLMMVPGGIQGNILRRMLTGGLAGAGIGAAQYVPEGGSLLKNILLGGTVGVSIPAVAGLVTKGYNAWKGGTETPEQAALIDYSEKHHVPLYAADVSDNPLITGTTYGLQNMPPVPGFSMAPPRKAQMSAAKQDVSNYINKLTQQMSNMPYGGKKGMVEIQQAAAGYGPRSSAAKSVLEEIQNAGADWNRIIQTSGNVRLLRSKMIADRKYDHVSQIADKYGPVSLDNTNKILDDSLNKASQDVVPNTELIKTLQTLKQNLNKGELNYSQVRDARGSVGNIIDRYFSGSNAAVGKDGVQLLQPVKNALGQDLNFFAQKNGNESLTAWKNADNFYRNNVVPAKNGLLAKSLKTEEPDNIYAWWIKKGYNGDRANQFYRALDNKGRAAVKVGMVTDAFTKASHQNEKFSTGRFASEINDIKSSKNVFFNNQDRAQIDGMANFMEHIGPGYRAISKPDTGIQTIPYLVGIGGIAGKAAGLVSSLQLGVGLLGVYGLNKLMSTATGRNYLIAASKLKAGTPQMQRLIDLSNQFIQRGTVASQFNKTNDNNEGGQ